MVHDRAHSWLWSTLHTSIDCHRCTRWAQRATLRCVPHPACPSSPTNQHIAILLVRLQKACACSPPRLPTPRPVCYRRLGGYRLVILQVMTVLSWLADAKVLPSGANATHSTCTAADSNRWSDLIGVSGTSHAGRLLSGTRIASPLQPTT